MVEPANRQFEAKLKLKVSLVEEYRAGLPFALKTRHGIATVIAFYGDSEEVGGFMQAASNSTRAYFVNANGLSGFVLPFSISKYLKRAKEQNQISELTKHQQIDIEALL